MQLKTILNHIEKQKGFVYRSIEWGPEHKSLKISIRPRRRSRPVCSGCHRPGPCYDTQPERSFEFVPVWAIPVFFLYRMRRVDCRNCGVTVERVPWSDGKHRTTFSYRLFLSRWAKRLSWQETATIFGTSWDTVYRSIRWVVRWGIANQDIGTVEAIGIDEIQYRRGHRYLTLVHQSDEGCRRLLYVARDRTEESLRGFFGTMPEATVQGLQYVCSDMWRNYLTVIEQCCGHAVHILDRFHVRKKSGDKINKVRAEEARHLKEDGYEPVLKNSRWCLLKRRENLTLKQTVKLKELLRYNLRSVRAYLMREDFQRFWTYRSVGWAGKFLDEWCTRAMRSQIEPMKEMARTLRGHRELLLNWFRARGELSCGSVEGVNNKAKLAIRKAYGFKSYETIEIALYHRLGKLPEPDLTHGFC
ncbi:MAG: ISL3 family transposase [Planctomycetaceae bacterium]